MRHARANPAGTGQDACPDLLRELAAIGWTQARRIGERLRREGPIGLILSSPATRCQQTSQGVIEGLRTEVAPAIIVREELGCDDATSLVPELGAAGDSVLVVSHQPTIVSLGAALMGAAGAPLDLRPAQVALLSREGGIWRLRAVLDPASP
jgi:phosphohistidine phosphatase SixA